MDIVRTAGPETLVSLLQSHLEEILCYYELSFYEVRLNSC